MASPKPGSIIREPTLPKPVEVLALVPMRDSFKVMGQGLGGRRISRRNPLDESSQ